MLERLTSTAAHRTGRMQARCPLSAQQCSPTWIVSHQKTAMARHCVQAAQNEFVWARNCRLAGPGRASLKRCRCTLITAFCDSSAKQKLRQGCL